MLDFSTAIELMKQYGYSSTSIHPYIYQKGDTLGICYTYIDEEYGLLERIKTFDNLEEFENFLKEQSWLKSNAKNYNVRMILDNYESSMPKVLYLRNEKIMMEGEMFDIDNFDLRESQRRQMDEASQILYEAGDLLLVYDEIKARQLQYLQNLISLKNELRGKYFDLQKEVDKYNKYKVERELNLLPDVLDKGSIDEDLEIAIKNQYNMYIADRPSLNEIKDFIRQVWELNMKLELNTKYYEAQKEENDTRNELKVVNQKLELMQELNEELRPIFGIDLVSRFKKINDKCRRESKYMSKNYVEERLALVEKKYAVFDKLNSYYMSDYLREAIQNTNYDDLALKYSVAIQDGEINKSKLPLNEVAADLAIQYKEKLSSEEQSILILYNNSKYAKIFDAILEIDKYEEKPLKEILKTLNSVKGISKLKSECYESVKKRINDPVNENIKNSLFANVDFTSFETFITGMIKKLVTLKNINNKMTIKSDFNMYSLVQKADTFAKRKYILLTHDLNTMLNDARELNWTIGICLLKENLPVLYSPYYFDLGDLYSKGASPLMEIKDVTNFELLIETADVSIYTDENKVEVARYYTEPQLMENISYVDDIKLKYSTIFNKFSLVSNLSNVEEVPVVNDNNAVNTMPFVENSMVTISNAALENVSNVIANPEEQQVVSNQPAGETVSSQNNETAVAPEQTIEQTPVEQQIEVNTAEVANEEQASIENKEEVKEPEGEQNQNETATENSSDSPVVSEETGIESKIEETTNVPTTESVTKPEENKEAVLETANNESTMVSAIDIKSKNDTDAPSAHSTEPVIDEAKEAEATVAEVVPTVENKVETSEPVTESVENKEAVLENANNEPTMVSAVDIKNKNDTDTPSVQSSEPVIDEAKADEVAVAEEAPTVENKIETSEPVVEEKEVVQESTISSQEDKKVEDHEVVVETKAAEEKAKEVIEYKPKEEKKDNGFVTFTNQPSDVSLVNNEKQEISTADFKTIVDSNNSTNNTNKPSVTTQKNVKVVKKVSSVGASKPKEVVTNTSSVTNNNATSSQASAPVKKNIVVKSVGSIGKPLNKNNN